jgi:protein-S-isoprenylcysteine O-methyltransferase Ste14
LDLIKGLLAAGMVANGLLLAALAWSVWRPAQRLWPPEGRAKTTATVAWILTVVVFGTSIAVAVLDWGALGFASWIRWMLGLPLIITGNVVVWWGVAELGWEATSGADGKLRTRGLYAWSRNPQCVADMAILVGIGLLSASAWAWPIIAAGCATLLFAPFSEEPWLRQRHGRDYDVYAARTRRFL